MTLLIAIIFTLISSSLSEEDMEEVAVETSGTVQENKKKFYLMIIFIAFACKTLLVMCYKIIKYFLKNEQITNQMESNDSDKISVV